MENKTALVFFSTLLLSCFIAQSIAFFGFKKYKHMSNTDKSLFDASKIVIDATNIVYSREGTKESDQIKSLPGQPRGITFNQYGGFVTVDQKAGRALYYYFAEAQNYAQASLPLILWLNGGPGCSSLAYGAMQELGPFRVKSDGKTLFLNKYAWNQAANVLFLESPAGVGFSYSKTEANFTSGDKKTASDNYVFLVNWLTRFPEYKNRDFYIAGESYAGHYVPQLAQIILHRNKKANMPTINLKGIIIGNADLNDETDDIGQWKYLASHALISEDLANRIIKECNGSTTITTSDKCNKYFDQSLEQLGNINIYNIYAPICLSNHTDITPKITSIINPDPCSDKYVHVYMNRADVQKALHVNVIKNIPYNWELCSDVIFNNWNWTDSLDTVLPLLKELMNDGLRVWIFSGDIDSRMPVTSTQLSIGKMKLHIQHEWRPWYINKEVGGYTQEYKGNLTLVTVRGAGHEVPTYQPEKALVLIHHFLKGVKLPVS